MKILMKVKKINNYYVWKEEYDIDNSENAREYAEKMVNNFNNTLRQGESARQLVDIEIIDYNSVQKFNHDWEKTNLVTLSGRSGTYDTMRCSRCGITGKRYGLGGSVTRDSKYKSKKYDYCNQ